MWTFADCSDPKNPVVLEDIRVYSRETARRIRALLNQAGLRYLVVPST